MRVLSGDVRRKLIPQLRLHPCSDEAGVLHHGALADFGDEPRAAPARDKRALRAGHPDPRRSARVCCDARCDNVVDERIVQLARSIRLPRDAQRTRRDGDTPHKGCARVKDKRAKRALRHQNTWRTRQRVVESPVVRDARRCNARLIAERPKACERTPLVYRYSVVGCHPRVTELDDDAARDAREEPAAQRGRRSAGRVERSALRRNDGEQQRVSEQNAVAHAQHRRGAGAGDVHI